MNLNVILSIAVVIFVSYSLYGLSEMLMARIVKLFVRPKNYSSKESEERRELTLTPFFTRIFRTVVVVVAIFQILLILSIDPGPVLAAAGIIGVALGLGAQSLVRDFFTGMVLVFENQYRVGDSICLGDVCGDVEEVTLRVTRLRDADGTVHYIPHGDIKKVSNRSRGFSRINLNITVPYETDLEELTDVIKRAGEEFAADSEWAPLVHVAPRLLRLDDFNNASVIVKVGGETAPGRSTEVSGEFRRRLKRALDQAGISATAAHGGK